MFIRRSGHPLVRAGAAALTTGGLLILGGCGGTEGPEAGTDVEDIQNESSRNRLAALDGVRSFVGQQVTVSAEVDEVIGPKAFTIADESGEQLLVVYDGTPRTLDPDTGIRVTGVVHKAFSPAEDFGATGFDDQAARAYRGEPYIQATDLRTDARFDREQ